MIRQLLWREVLYVKACSAFCTLNWYMAKDLYIFATCVLYSKSNNKKQKQKIQTKQNKNKTKQKQKQNKNKTKQSKTKRGEAKQNKSMWLKIQSCTQNK